MKIQTLLPLFLCTLLLAGCSDTGSSPEVVSGIVTDCVTAPDGQVTSFVVTDDQGKELTVEITDRTTFYPTPTFSPAVEVLDPADFAQLQQDGLEVAVSLYQKEDLVNVELLYHQTDTTLPLAPQGEAILWAGTYSDSYRLADGTELLRVDHTSGPANVHVVGIPSFDQLPEQTQAAILTFFDDQGVLYDVEAEVQKAFDAYTALEDPSDFDGFQIRQEISPSAASEAYVYYLTTVSLPLYDGQTYTERQLGAIFDRETGTAVPLEDLFTCDAAALPDALLDRAQMTEEPLRQELLDAFAPSCVIFFQDTLTLSYAQGVLPSQEHAFGIGLEYSTVSDLLLPEARPENIES